MNIAQWIGFIVALVSIMFMNAFLMYNNVDGWGWFLLVSLIIISGFKSKKEGD